jgi:hypothetical protein
VIKYVYGNTVWSSGVTGISIMESVEDVTLINTNKLKFNDLGPNAQKLIETLVYKELIKRKEDEGMTLLSASGILFVTIIVIVTVKLLIPKLTHKTVVWLFATLIYFPVKKQIDALWTEWKALIKPKKKGGR